MKAFVRLCQNRLLLIVAFIAVVYAIIIIAVTRPNVGLSPDVTDYAETARSLVQGHGYTINRIQMHSGLLEQIRHPLEMHGVLRPLEIAPIFYIFGESDLMARMPAILYAAALSVMIFVIGRRLFGAIVGFVAVAWLVSHDYFEIVTFVGGDDVGLAFWSAAIYYCFLRAMEERSKKRLMLVGCLAFFATLEKLVALILPFTLVFVILVSRRARWAARARLLLPVVAPSLLAASVYLLRNYLAHGGFGFRYNALEWLATKDLSAYFVYTPHTLSLFDVWSQLGFWAVAERIFGQFGLLPAIIVRDPFTVLGGLVSLLYLLRRQPLFALIGLLYSLLVLVNVCITHHLEQRYLFGSFPFYILAFSSVLVRVVEALAGSVPASARRYVLVGAATFAVLWFGQRVQHIIRIPEQLGIKQQVTTPCADALRFVQSSIDPTSPILTTNPWFVTWNSDRPAVMAPTNGDAAFRVIVDHYKPDWAFVGVTTFGALDLKAELARLSKTNQLRSKLAYDGTQCDVYRLYRQ